MADIRQSSVLFGCIAIGLAGAVLVSRRAVPPQPRISVRSIPVHTGPVHPGEEDSSAVLLLLSEEPSRLEVDSQHELAHATARIVRGGKILISRRHAAKCC